ncbi:MAG: DUF349 domain-containing protein [Flavobacteriaceae bacterium]|nr:DUF349 domain-containing protein [Flavobacteriaceae bacterium]
MSQQENDKAKNDLPNNDLNEIDIASAECNNNLEDSKSKNEEDNEEEQFSETTDNIKPSEPNIAEKDDLKKKNSDSEVEEIKSGSEKEESEAPIVASEEVKKEAWEEAAAKDTGADVMASETPQKEEEISESNKKDEEEDDDEKSSIESAKKNAHSEFEESVAEESEDESAKERHGIAKQDYHAMSKEDLVAEMEKLVAKEKIQAIKEHIDEIKAEFNAKFDEDFEEKKEEFLAEGGNIIDFHYSTPVKKLFNSIYFDYKEKRNHYYHQLKQDLNKNLDIRLQIIEELKGLLDVEENINTTYKHFKELQDRWRTAGAIPRDKYNTVWNTYHHHVENFYDFLHLNRDFRDMDFKHNLEQKLKIIDRAEELTQENDTNRALRELQMLHKMWKEELGPVAKEFREDIWERFSEATKKIHDLRQAYYDQLDQEYEKNLEQKKEICAKIKTLVETQYTAHSQWQQKIKELNALRDEFFKVGKVPREKNESTWSEFKQNVRQFNRNKNAYYKSLKKEQYDNLEKKRELIKIADDNKDSEDFKATTALMKKIQADWKKVGHVPRKESDKVWKQFKAACNYYFDRLHTSNNEEDAEENKAFDQKKEILDGLKSYEFSGDKKTDLSKIKEAIEGWKNIGKVPYNKRFIEGKFNKLLDQLFSKLDVDRTKAEMMKYENKIQALNNADDDAKLRNEHYFLTKKVQETKDEIRQLENNLQFFADVNTDNPLVKAVHKNIQDQKDQLEVWKEKLEKIKSIY